MRLVKKKCARTLELQGTGSGGEAGCLTNELGRFRSHTLTEDTDCRGIDRVGENLGCWLGLLYPLESDQRLAGDNRFSRGLKIRIGSQTIIARNTVLLLDVYEQACVCIFRGWPHGSTRCPVSGYHIQSATLQACSITLVNKRLARSNNTSHYGPGPFLILV